MTIRLAAPLVAILAMLVLAQPASAVTRAQAVSAAVSAASGSFGAVGGPVGTTPPAAGTTISASWGAGGSGSQYFQVTNTGSLALTGASYALSASFVLLKNTDIVLEACNGAVFTASTGACPGGTVVTLASSATAGPAASLAPAAPGAVLSVRLRPLAAVFLGASATVSISVSRAQARAATTTNS